MKNEIKQEIDKFLKEIWNLDFFSKIEFIILYGSYLNEYHYDESDIDLCIYVQDGDMKLARIRLNLLEKFEDKFDIQMFQLLPIYVQIEVLKGEVLYVKDEDLLYEIAYKTIEEYEDFYPFYLDYINR
jgi:hypothetical protein